MLLPKHLLFSQNSHPLHIKFHFQFLKHANPPSQKRKLFGAASRLTWSIVKIPLTAAGLGTGASAYIVYKVNGK